MTPNLCKDCHYFVEGYEHECHHPDNVSIDLVWGGTTYDIRPVYLRGLKEKCGTAGAWFKPKAPE